MKIRESNCGAAVKQLQSGDVRYDITLNGHSKAFK